MPRTTPPEVERQILLGDQPVAYQLRRSTRRTIGLTIDHRGLRVGAPQRARLGDIENLIREHGQWVLDKLARWRGQAAPAPLALEDGAALDIAGTRHTLRLTDVGRRWQLAGTTLYVRAASPADAAPVLEKALRDTARALFLERLALYAPRLGVAPPPLRLSSARTRWGSCSHRGHIALNWRLILMPLPVIDYVVCHELAHLKEMNHSPRFWSVVEHLCPDWAARRLELRQLGRQLPHL